MMRQLRADLVHDRLVAFAKTLSLEDEVVIEVTGNSAAVEARKLAVRIWHILGRANESYAGFDPVALLHDIRAVQQQLASGSSKPANCSATN
ncbi:hypothetical protein [Bradyrhizobium yuanmingense]|uniref:hypothetical protein n=1 Tax=Bradyrhizobium yuanmingense TaxID=108015 RepID=UPI003D2F51AA